jgi:carbonic anhydrase
MSHKAQAIIQTCIDFRFREPLNKFIEEELNLHSVDIKTDGGGVKKIFEEGPIRDWIFANYEIAFDLHGVERVILINHQDCGAYGGSKAHPNEQAEIDAHEIQLRHSVSIVRAKYPNKQIDAYLALIDKNGNVTFKQVI